jgi:mRNA interferase RelE/StbE
VVYAINFSRQAIKELEKIPNPFYLNIKQAIINLSKNPRPNGFKKLKGRDGY